MSEKIGLRPIKDSKSYYEIENGEMVTFASIKLVYQYARDIISRDKQPVPERPPDSKQQVAVLGGFYSDCKNIIAFHELMAELDLRPLYLDINAQPGEILSPEQRANFHQMDLSNIATETVAIKRINESTGEEETTQERLIEDNSIRMMVMDYTTLFMDTAQIEKLFAGLKATLAEDGVCLMTVNKPSLIQWMRMKFVMGLRTTMRSIKEWKALAEKDLHVTTSIDFMSSGRTKCTLMVITQKDNPYKDRPAMSRSQNDLMNYQMRKAREAPKLKDPRIK